MSRVLVLGSGVIGLSCALRILEENPLCDLTILSKDVSPNTTSDGADQQEKNQWPVVTCRVETVYPDHIETPYFRNILDNYKIENNLRGSMPIVSWTAPLVNTTAYLQKLTERIKSLGGKFMIGTVTDINDLIKSFGSKIDIIINCMGLGAKSIFKDTEIIPVRGVLVVLEPVKSIRNLVINLHSEEHITYIISREDKCILGGSGDMDSYDLNIDQKEIDRIISECSKLAPELLENDSIKKIRYTWVGLRPYRSCVRLEIDRTFSLPIIHCYGHGGSGWTVHWGCAQEVLQLYLSLSHPHKL